MSENKLEVGQELYYRYRTRASGNVFGYCKITYVGKKYFVTDRPGQYRDQKTEIASMRDGSLQDRSITYYTSKEAYDEEVERKRMIKIIEGCNLHRLETKKVRAIHDLII